MLSVVVIAGRYRAILAVAVLATLALTEAPALRAQATMPAWQKEAGGGMSFEVASVRPSEDRDVGSFPLNAENTYRQTGGSFTASLPLQVYVEFAYKLTPEEAGDWLSHVPKWVDSENYAIRAKASTPNPTKDQMRLMMQSLLAERFNLKVHFEAREVPVYRLAFISPGKFGPRLRLHSQGPPCPTNQSDDRPYGFDPKVWPPTCEFNSAPPGMPNNNPLIKRSSEHNVLLGGRNIDPGRLAVRLRGFADRPIVDATGLSEPIDLALDWTPEPGQPMTAFDREALMNGQFERTSLRQALKEQLGMKLESARAPVSFLVVDHVERPSEN